MTDAPSASAAPTCTSTRSPPTARPASRRSSTTSSGRPTSTSSPSPTTSGSTPRVAARAIARDRGLRVEVVVGEEVTTLGGHLLALYLDRPIKPYRSLRDTIAGHPRRGRPRHPGPPARPVPAVRPGLGPASPARRPGPGAPAPTRSRRSTRRRLGKPWHSRVVRFADEHGLAHVGNSDAHALDGDRRRAGRRSRAATPRDLRARDRDPGDRPRRRPSTRRPASSARSGSSSASAAATRATRSRGRVRRDGTGRDHGYPGGRLRPPRYEPRDGPRARAGDEDRPGLPVHLPGAGRRRPARPATSTRTSACAATTSGSSPPATARSARRRATSCGSASASACRPTARSGR